METQAQTKAQKARAIFAEMNGQPGVARKDVIARIQTECDLGKAAAATYYQNAKDKAGLVHHRTTVAPATETTTAPAAEVAPAETAPAAEVVADKPRKHGNRRHLK